MNDEICIQSRLETITGDHQLDEIPNDENTINDGKKKLLINETKEFIPKSYYESKSNYVSDDLKKGGLEAYIKYDEETFNRIQTYNFDKFSESNKIDVKILNKPWLNQEEMQCKKSNMSFIFETENSFKEDCSDKNINSGSNQIKNLNFDKEHNEMILVNNDQITNNDYFLKKNNNNNIKTDNFEEKFAKNIVKNTNHNNLKNFENEFDDHVLNNYNNNLNKGKSEKISQLKEEDITLVEKENFNNFSKSYNKNRTHEKCSSQVLKMGNINQNFLEANNDNFKNINKNNNNSSLMGNQITKANENFLPNNFSNTHNQLISVDNRKSCSNTSQPPKKYNTSSNQKNNCNFNITTDNLNVQNLIEKYNENNDFDKNADESNNNIIIHSIKDPKKNGSSNGLLEEMNIEDKDNINLKNAFNLENTNYKELNTSNTIHKNEIELIAYNSGNMGEFRPKRYNKTNIEKGKQFFKERYIKIKYNEHLKKNSDKNISKSDIYKTDDKHIIKLNRVYILKLEKGIFCFNLKLFEDSFNQLKNSGIILDEEEFAEILLVSSGFDKFMIGDFLAKEKEPNIKGKILWLFLEKIDFNHMEFIDAIRFLLSRINLPQDSTLILGILDVFTQVYHKDNQGKFKDSNTIYLLASTILAINTLFHKNMANMPSLKKEDFIKMNKDVDPVVLDGIYEEVKVNKLDFTYEYSNQFYRRICFNTTTKDLIISSDPHNLREIASNVPTTKNDKSIKTEEILKMLKTGEIFIKYGNKGSPHPRLVQLSQDEKRIVWRKISGCNIFCKTRSINLTDIRDVYFGISSSKIFEKYNLPPQDDSFCFSISTDARTLDLRKDDENICKKWFNALKFITKKSRSMKELKQNKSFVNNFKKRLEFIGDIWKTEIIPNWSIYRDLIIPSSKYKIEYSKETLHNQNLNVGTQKKNKENFLNSIYFRLSELFRKSKENMNNKKVIEEKDRAEFFYFLSLGIPDWLRKRLWPLMIGNESSINENIFNFYLKQVEEVNFVEISTNIDEKFKEQSQKSSKSKNIYLKKASTHMIDFEKSVKKIQLNFSLEPLLNEIIIDIINISKKYNSEIVQNNLEKLTLQKELFEIIRVFCMSRPDVTYSKQITYISLFLYLNSENFYTAFVNLSNIMISSYLIKFLTNDEIFIKSRLDFFERLLKKYHKQVYEHFTKIEISTSLYFYNWMEYLFMKFFKYNTLLRVWDIYLLKGERFLYELALAIIKMQEKDLKNYSVTEVLHNLKKFNQKLNEEEFFDLLHEIDLSEDYNIYLYEINLASEKGALLQTFMSEWI